MGNKVITINLKTQDIDEAIKEVEAYKAEIARKTNLLAERIAKRISENAQSGFNGSIVDDLVNGTARKANVSVSWTGQGNLYVVIAQGKDAVFVEFGAGVYHNGAVGGSPHPKGAELGLTIGSYGQGKGKNPTWSFIDEDGKLKRTHGTPATMPMERAFIGVLNDFVKIAREVFA